MELDILSFEVKLRLMKGHEYLYSFLSSKHVVFGQVVSGQSVVDTIENVPVNSSNSRPLKDVVISHCGQLVLVSSKSSRFV